jgi:hypothetical protein
MAAADGIRAIAFRTNSGRNRPGNIEGGGRYSLTGRGSRDSVVVYLGNRKTKITNVKAARFTKGAGLKYARK